MQLFGAFCVDRAVPAADRSFKFPSILALLDVYVFLFFFLHPRVSPPENAEILECFSGT